MATGGYFVSAEASGLASGSAAGGHPVFVAWGERKKSVDIVLRRGGAKLVGRVVDITGGPVGGALIRATRVAIPHDTIAVRSGQDGVFRLWVEPGSISLMASSVGYAPVRLARVAPSSDLVIRMIPASTVQGEVVTADEGRRVPQVDVRAIPAGSWNSPVHPSGTSDAEGLFTISVLEPGKYRFVAEGEGWSGQSMAMTEVGLATRLDHVQVTVSPASTVDGTVVEGSTGGPCEQGTVTLRPAGNPAAGNANTSQGVAAIAAGGAVHFRALMPGDYNVDVRCSDHLLADGPTTIHIAAASVGGLVWKVEPGLGMVIRCIDETGQPLPGARARLLIPAKEPGGQKRSRLLQANAEGTLEVAAELLPGTYTVEPDGPYEGPPSNVELRAGMQKADVMLRFSGPGAIMVNVRTPEGSPIDDVTVSAVRVTESDASSGSATATNVITPASVRADPQARDGIFSQEAKFAGISMGNGRFRAGPLARGRYRVQVEDGLNPTTTPEGSPGGIIEVVRGTTESTVTLDRSATIRGRVVDSSNEPLPDVWISAVCPRDGADTNSVNWQPAPPGFLSRREISDAEGRFVLGGLLRDARCTVRAERPYGAMGQKLDVLPGDDVVISLPAPATLEGMAQTAQGDPVERFTINIREERTEQMRTEVVSAPGGHWTLPKVEPGSVQIDAKSLGNVAQLHLDLAPGSIVNSVQLNFRPRSIPQAASQAAAR